MTRKYIWANRGDETIELLFDLNRDPDETTSMDANASIPLGEDTLEALRSATHETYEAAASQRRSAQRVDLAPDTRRALKDLGYMH